MAKQIKKIKRSTIRITVFLISVLTSSFFGGQAINRSVDAYELSQTDFLELFTPLDAHAEYSSGSGDGALGSGGWGGGNSGGRQGDGDSDDGHDEPGSPNSDPGF
jgi:hypothetical protein